MTQEETTTAGICPSDIILRSVIKLGLDSLRRNPDDLDAVYETLSADEETVALYGDSEATRAKDWFKKNDVPVRIVDSLDPPTATSITIKLHESQAVVNQLGDTNVVPSRPDNLVWRSLTGTFAASSYDPATGAITLPDDMTLVVVPGMIIIDKSGQELPVLTVPTSKQIRIAAGSVVDLTSMDIRGAKPTRAAGLESMWEKETYRVGVWTSGEGVYMAWLFPILKYVLYRGRIDLERRGMINPSFSFTGPELVGDVGPTETMFSRFAIVTATVKQTWVTSREERIYSVETDLTVASTDPNQSGILLVAG